MTNQPGPSSKACAIVVLFLSGVMVLLALLPLLSGGKPNAIAILLNIPVVLAVAFKARFLRRLVLVWAALPLVSLAFYLVGAALQGTWGPWPGPLFFVVAGILGLGIFMWARRALPISA